MPFLDWLGLGSRENVVPESELSTAVPDISRFPADEVQGLQSRIALTLNNAFAATASYGQASNSQYNQPVATHQDDYYQQLANQQREYYSQSTFVIPTSGVYNINIPAGQSINTTPGVISYSGLSPVPMRSISGPCEIREMDSYLSDEQVIETYHYYRKQYLEMLLVKPWEMV